MSKKLTEQQIRKVATENGIDYASLRAVIDVEARGSGFFSNGLPAILFERHIFWRRLGAIRWFTMRAKIMALHPRICNPIAGGYGRFSEQHTKLGIAASYNRDVALESASWGLGQVMGYHWKSLGYASLQEFINAMYHSEYKQLDAMVRFLKVNGLIGRLNRQDWSGFAYRYNGAGYARNNYDEKLAQAYRKYR